MDVLFRMNPMRFVRRKLIGYVVGATLLLTVAIAIKPAFNAYRDSRIAYHRSRMNYYYEVLYVQRKSIPSENWVGELFGYEVPSPFDYHRSKLVGWGVLTSIDYSFQHIQIASPEWKHLSRRIHLKQCPNYDHSAGNQGSALPGPYPAWRQIWCDPKERDAWLDFLRSVDVPDYRTRFMGEQQAQPAK